MKEGKQWGKDLVHRFGIYGDVSILGGQSRYDTPADTQDWQSLGVNYNTSSNRTWCIRIFLRKNIMLLSEGNGRDQAVVDMANK
jgi:hypothetical protein